jgi:hypothetical protein
MAGARSAAIDDQNDGHTVDVLVGQLRVEEAELELEIVAEVEAPAGTVLTSKPAVSKGTRP